MGARCFRLGVVVLAVTHLTGGWDQARAESQHVFGIHFWGRGACTDVMSHRTGWVVEANLGQDSLPDIDDKINPLVGEGFTLIQRLDWRWGFDYDKGTVPKTPGDRSTFASQCSNWANHLKDYCRHYVIGNEMELHDGVTVEIYVLAFQAVRNAIKAVQPEARVIIGHYCTDGSLRQAIQMLGPDGYDGVADHTGSSVGYGRLQILDDENARPGVGVYITEWGWVTDTNPNAEDVILGFYNAIGDHNAQGGRQVYCACWFTYTSWGGGNFWLQGSVIDNPAFEAATALGTSVNSYADNPVIMSDLFADILDSSSSIVVRWNTNVPARTQVWWKRYNQSWGTSSTLSTTPLTVHTTTIPGLWASTEYEVMPNSTADDYADAGGRRFRIKTGPWNTDVTQTGAGRALVHWTTDWPTDSVVEYGATLDLGQSVQEVPLVTDHHVQITGLPAGTLFYRVLSSEENPDPNGPRLYMRSPIRTFDLELLYPGDMDGDCDVDQEDFGLFQVCYSGPGIAQDDPACMLARLDDDEDVDSNDFATFQGCMTAPGTCASPDCAND